MCVGGYIGTVTMATGSVQLDTELSSPEHTADSKDPRKKKTFFKNFKQLFKRKKGSKLKDGSNKSQSVANVSSVAGHSTDEELDGQCQSTTALSLSHDSVFSPDTVSSHAAHPGPSSAKSMDRLPVGGFKNELASKLQGGPRKGDGRLLAVPGARTHPTDDQLENGHRLSGDRSYESDLSMDGSNGELNDFFKEKWASSSSLSKQQTPTEADTEINLDIISSTASLNTEVAKHKIAVKQKGKRVSANVLAKRRANSPRPQTVAVQHLPELTEESQPSSDGKITTSSTSDGGTHPMFIPVHVHPIKSASLKRDGRLPSDRAATPSDGSAFCLGW